MEETRTNGFHAQTDTARAARALRRSEALPLATIRRQILQEAARIRQGEYRQEDWHHVMARGYGLTMTDDGQVCGGKTLAPCALRDYWTQQLQPTHKDDARMEPRESTGFLFPFGRILATPGALSALEKAEEDGFDYLCRHGLGDWGECDADDSAANTAAMRQGTRIFSAYRLSTDTRLWIITEADRSATTLLLPEEY